MLSRASSLVSWTRSSPDAGRLLGDSSAASRSTSASHTSKIRLATTLANVSTRTTAAKTASKTSNGSNTLTKSSSLYTARNYHTSLSTEKKKETNTKSLATQGKKTKEKVEDDSAAKLAAKAGPGALGKEDKLTKEQEQAALMAKSAEAAANPDGLLIDQISYPGDKITGSIVKGADKLAPMLEKMKEKYPATYDLLRYQAIRTPEAERLRIFAKSVDFDAIYADPEMAAFKSWWDRLEGQGSAENALRKDFRQILMHERRNLASTWQELDAKVAELKSQEETFDLMLPLEEYTPEELAEIEADPELKAAINENPLDDPEIQLILNYMMDPRAEIDPTGVLGRALGTSVIQDADLLKLADRADQVNAEIMGTRNRLSNSFGELVGQTFEEVQRLAAQEPPTTDADAHASWSAMMANAKEAVEDANKKGHFGSPQFQQLFQRWSAVHGVEEPSDLLKVRMLIDALEPRRTVDFPKLRQLTQQGREQDIEEHILHDAEDEAEIAQETFAANFIDDIEGEDMDELEEADTAFNDLLEQEPVADDEEIMDAMYPDYAETVIREFPDQTFLPQVDPTQRQASIDTFKRQVDAVLTGKMNVADELSGPENLRDGLGALEGLEGEKFDRKLASLLNMPTLTLREASREFLRDRFMEAAAAQGIIEDPHAQADESLTKYLVQKIRASLASATPEEQESEQMKDIQSVLDAVDAIKDDELGEGDHLPVDNPLNLLNDTLQSLRTAKDVVLDLNAELNETEAHLEGIFESARQLTAHMMAKPEARPDGFAEIEKMHREVFGSQLPDPTTGLSSDDLMNEWAIQMKEKVMLMEARTTLEREQAAVDKMKSKQLEKFFDAKEPVPTSSSIPDSGVYPFSAADILVERPVEERIYISSDKDVEEIFSSQGVGKFLTLTDEDVKRYFPEGFSSRLTKQEFHSTGTHSILIRPQAIEAINNLKAQQASSFLGSASLSRKQRKSVSPSSVARPMLLHGYRGCGKSAVLSQVIYWARRSGWLVVSIPDGTASLADGVYISKNSTEGTWDQPKFFVKFFGQLLTAHHDKLKQIPLKNKVTVGKFTPKTLFDLVEYGSVLEAQAAQCFTAFKSEIRRVVEFPVLLAFDSYNVLYNPSNSWKDPESTSYYKDPMDPYNMSLGRMFFDAHVNTGLAHGTFIGALTEAEPVRRFVERVPKADQVAPKYLEVPPYTVSEFTTVMEHYKHKQWVRTNMSSGSSSELYIYQLTSGFAEAIWSYTKKL